MDNQCKVTVIDCIPGSGKTSWAIDYMNTNTKIYLHYPLFG